MVSLISWVNQRNMFITLFEKYGYRKKNICTLCRMATTITCIILFVLVRCKVLSLRTDKGQWIWKIKTCTNVRIGKCLRRRLGITTTHRSKTLTNKLELSSTKLHTPTIVDLVWSCSKNVNRTTPRVWWAFIRMMGKHEPDHENDAKGW